MLDIMEGKNILLLSVYQAGSLESPHWKLMSRLLVNKTSLQYFLFQESRRNYRRKKCYLARRIR